MEAGKEEQGVSGGRCPDADGGGRVRRRSLPRRDRRATQGGDVPTECGHAAVHPEGGREEAAAGDPDGPGPGGADGGEAGAGAYLRGGFSSVLVRLSTPAQRDAGARATACTGSTRLQPCARR